MDKQGNGKSGADFILFQLDRLKEIIRTAQQREQAVAPVDAQIEEHQ